MAGVPRYISHQDFRPIEPVTDAPVLNAVSQSFDKMSESLQVQAGTQEGAKAGEDPGFQPLPALTPAIAAFNREAIQTNKLMAAAQSSQHLAMLKNEADLRFPDPGKASQFFNNSAASYSQQFLDKVPEVNKAYLSSSINHQLLVTNADFNKRIHQQKNADAFISYTALQQSNFDGMIGALHEGDVGDPKKDTTGGAQQHYQQIISSGELAFKSNLITKTQFKDLTEKAQNEYQKGFFLHGAQKTIQEGPESFSKFITKAKDDPKIKDTWIKKAETMAQSHVIGFGIDVQTVNNNGKQQLANALQTGTTNDHEIAQWKALHPEKAVSYQTNIDTNKLIHANGTLIAASPLAQQTNLLQEQRANFDSSSFADMQTLVSHMNAQIHDDPFKFFNANPSIRDSIINGRKIAIASRQAGVDITPSEIMNSTPTERNILAQRLRGMSGKNVMAAPKAEVERLTGLLQNGSFNEVRNALGAQQLKLGKNFPLLITNLISQSKRSGIPLDQSLTFITSLNPANPDSEKIFNALKVPTKDLKAFVDPEKVKEISAKLTDAFSPVQSFFSKFSSSFVSAELQTASIFKEFFPALAPISPLQGAKTDDYIKAILNASPTTKANDHLDALGKFMSHVSLFYAGQGSSANDAFDNAEKAALHGVNVARQFLSDETPIPQTTGPVLSVAPLPNMRTQASDTMPTGPHLVFPKIVEGRIVDAAPMQQYLSKARQVLKKFKYVVPASISPKSAPGARRAVYYRLNVQKGHWVNNREINGVIYVDNIGRPVTDANGNPFEVLFSDAVNNLPFESLLAQNQKSGDIDVF